MDKNGKQMRISFNKLNSTIHPLRGVYTTNLISFRIFILFMKFSFSINHNTNNSLTITSNISMSLN